MPPKAAPLQNTLNLSNSSVNVSAADSEVSCPLTNADGTHCRKRCLGEKRYRSMQEHIRRAHPEYYIAKLPATKESFELMITSPPHERPPPPEPVLNNHHLQHHPHLHHIQHSDPSGLSPAYRLDAALNSSYEGYHALGQYDGGYHMQGDADAQAILNNMQSQQRSSDEYRRGSIIPAASAAAALAQLHYHRAESEWGGNDMTQNFYADQNNDLKNHAFQVDPALEDHSFMPDPSAFQVSSGQDPSSMLSSDRPSTLPPLHRSFSRSQNRPRKTSLSHQARLAKHERKRSKELAKRISGDKKSFSGEPSAAALYGKRWEDLIDAATSATEEEDSRDLTPIPASPYQSPQVTARTSLPPFAMGSQFQSFQASPLNRALTPPVGAVSGGLDLTSFPSVDSTISSNLSHQHHDSTDSTGSQFHIMNPNSMESNSSPMFNAQPVQIYCSGCRRLTSLKDAYACTNCICGLCTNCVEAIISGQSRGRMSMCPRCSGMDSNFKPFQLDLR